MAEVKKEVKRLEKAVHDLSAVRDQVDILSKFDSSDPSRSNDSLSTVLKKCR